jgi:aromatic-L-amino-acid/L-tryptophan decarboxylase
MPTRHSASRRTARRLPYDRAVTGYPLEPDDTTLQTWGDAVLSRVVDHERSLADVPVACYDVAESLLELLAARPPEDAGDLPVLLDVVGEAARVGLVPSSPGYLAYVPVSGLYAGALAELLAAGLNRYVTIARIAPALAALENSVIRWLCELFGFPASSAGILTSGGSMANFSGVVTARVARLGDRFADGVVYVGEHTHHSVAKSARLAGFPPDALRTVASGDGFRLDVDALGRAVADDRAAGRRPALVVANAGSTDTGSVDALGPLADLCGREGLWLHVDAAYGGFFQLTERGRRRLSGIERADSITVDPHKGLFLPLATGALVVRDVATLRAAHALEATYLQDAQPWGDVLSAADLSPELSRDFRGLRVWLPLHLHGVAAFRDALDEKLDLTVVAYEALRQTDGLEVLHEPELTTVAFRAHDDDQTRAVLEHVNQSGRVVLSSTMLDGRPALRMCIQGHRTHRERVDEALALVREGLRC